MRSLIIFITLLLLTSLLSTSCVNMMTVKKNYAETREYGVSKNPIQNRSMVAEYEVDLSQKISGTFAVTNGDLEGAKNLALWDAITKSSADAIVDPIYKVSQDLKTITVETYGYKAKFKDIRIATKQDLIDYISLLITTNGIQLISYEMFKIYYKDKEIQAEITETSRLSDEEIKELWSELSLDGSANTSSIVADGGKQTLDVSSLGNSPMAYTGKTGKQIWKEDVKPLKPLDRVTYINNLHPKDRKSYNKYNGRKLIIGTLVTIPLVFIVSGLIAGAV